MAGIEAGRGRSVGVEGHPRRGWALAWRSHAGGRSHHGHVRGLLTRRRGSHRGLLLLLLLLPVLFLVVENKEGNAAGDETEAG